MEKLPIKKIAPVIIGLGVAGLLLVFGFKFLSGTFTRAADIKPQNVNISAIGTNSATITWDTDVASLCVVQYDSSITNVGSGSFAPETTKTTNHSVELNLLGPATAYYFNIKCNDTTFDNQGVPYSFSTKDKNGGAVTPTTSAAPQATITITPPLPSPTTSSETSTCNETDCEKIKAKIGNGCTSRDYLLKCINGSPTPTLIQAQKVTPTPSPTP